MSKKRVPSAVPKVERLKKPYLGKHPRVGSYSLTVTEGEPGSYLSCYESDTYTPGRGTPVAVFPSLLDRNQTCRIGVVTPDYDVRSASGEIINTAYWRSTNKITGGGGSYFGSCRDGRKFTRVGPGSISESLRREGSITLPYASVNVVQDMALAKIRALSNMDKSRTQLGEDMAEVHSTWATIKSPVRDLLKKARRLDNLLARHLRKYGTRTKPTGQRVTLEGVKLLADTWLSVKYGLAQLVWTGLAIDDVVTLRANILRAKPVVRLTSRGKVDAEGKIDTVVISSFYSDRVSFHVRHTIVTETRAGILYSMKYPERRDSLGWQLGFTPKDMLPTAYNVLRLSWLLDRFVNIGDAIRATENYLDPELTILSAWTSVYWNEVRSFQATAYTCAPGSTWSVTVDGDVYESTQESVNRNPWAPDLYDCLPSEQVTRALTDMRNIADMAALTVQKLSITRDRLPEINLGGFNDHRIKILPMPGMKNPTDKLKKASWGRSPLTYYQLFTRP